ncbi:MULTISPECIES: hypothetical protein [unclassified Pseudomonas]|uniref:hypothetical protein n=1 Tax=unclassified Pseudomonas TaxID=196821 RepID=UPI002447B621|nr:MULTISPECIES: hypothetical protein [unclassified Pseudomonas]MDG9923635.1 hypothetical protein [Pseudomonas sp. GD04045]MDH0036397.1 hypothetical protein [Pseudomonas sp. GD04019]
MNLGKWAGCLLLNCAATLAQAELSLRTDGEVFGLAPRAPPAAFVKHLGAPTAELPLQQGRRGLLYGNALLLVFEGERLREVRCWKVAQFTDELFVGWLQDVESKGQPEGFVVDDRLRLGMPRQQVSDVLAGLEGAGDERSDLVQKNGRQIWLGYGPAPDYHLGDNPDQSVLVSISVLFEQP